MAGVIDRLARVWWRLRGAGRRRAAIERLRSIAALDSVLVLCHGNLCRSPYAAAVLARRLGRLGRPVSVRSAGFSTPNRTPPSDAVAEAARRGVDLSQHRSQSIHPGAVRDASLVLVMDRTQQRAVGARPANVERPVLLLGAFDPEPSSSDTIRDPLGRGPAAFAACYDRIDRCVVELVRALERA